MSTLVTVLHVIVCLFLMLTVLLQSGKSGGMGAAFGGGNAATVFGGSGASGFLQKLTAIGGTIFMITSMVLAFLSSQNSADSLEKFGKEQDSIALQKEKAKEEALKASKANKAPGAGSGSVGSGSAGPSSMSPPTTVTPDHPGSAATTPAEQPVPSSTKPATTATGSATTTPTGPATPTNPTPAPAPVSPTKLPTADTTPKPVDTKLKPSDTKPAGDAKGSAAPSTSSPDSPKP
jgi:preprotein translocase subunit SecG